MELKLNVYDKREIEKTYVANTYDLMYGTMEDMLDVLDLDKLNEDATDKALLTLAADVVKHGFPQLKPLLMDVFDGLTEDELRRCHVADLVSIMIKLAKYSLNEIKGAATGAIKEKNV